MTGGLTGSGVFLGFFGFLDFLVWFPPSAKLPGVLLSETLFIVVLEKEGMRSEL